jgi:hypothetical protein
MNSIELNGTGVLSHRLNALIDTENRGDGNRWKLQSENLIKMNYKRSDKCVIGRWVEAQLETNGTGTDNK